MQSILATGGTLNKRKEYINNQLSRLRILRFNQIHLTAQNSITIDQVRYLISKLHIKPIAAKLAASLRAGIILEAEKATIEAQNALLKLLEEPPKSARIFLSAPNPSHLLPTIVSRCKIVRLPQVIRDLHDLHDLKTAISPQSVAVAFQLAEKYGRDRKTADEFLKNTLLYIRQQYLHHSYNTKSHITHHTSHITYYAQLARRIQLSRRLIASNVNPRQVLENLLLS